MAEITNCDRLTIIGTAIYGKYWKRPLARDLGVDKRQVQRWVNGHSEPLDSRICQALAILHKKRERLESAERAVRLYPWIH
jgi:hypothetical protein